MGNTGTDGSARLDTDGLCHTLPHIASLPSASSRETSSYRPAHPLYVRIFCAPTGLFVCVCACPRLRVWGRRCLKHNLHAQFMMIRHGSDSAWLIRAREPEALLLGCSAVMDKSAPQIYVCKCRMGELPPAATAHANTQRGGAERTKEERMFLEMPGPSCVGRFN